MIATDRPRGLLKKKMWPWPHRARSTEALPDDRWHPHFGSLAGHDLAGWLSGFPDHGPPRRSIILATDERTGSEWLCQLLGATGRLGRPSEYLNTVWMRRFIADYPDKVPAQVAIAHQVGTTANHCFSMKVHPWHLERLLQAATVSGTFPGATFVRLIRTDLLGQAISLYRARQTGSYHAHIAPARDGLFDANAIEGLIRNLAFNRARWDMYFARTGVTPLMFSYEELSADPRGVVRRIADSMGERIWWRDFAAVRSIRQQADSVSDEWRQRYVRERGTIDKFDLLP